jgi:hypothetical protein
VRSWTIKHALAIGIAGALAMDAATALHAKLLSDGKATEHMGSNHLTPADRFPGLGALSGNTTGSPAVASPNLVTGVSRSARGAHAGRGPDGVTRNDNRGPDDYFAPRYRNGKCVGDEGNTLMAELTLGGGVRRMQGKSLERALASLCREAQESTRRVARTVMP